MAPRDYVNPLRQAGGAPRPRQDAKPRNFPPDRRRQVVEVHDCQQAHARLAGEPPVGPDVTPVVARHDDKVPAEGR
eukprot:7089242-Alexandrium_andersonii.AAC.1